MTAPPTVNDIRREDERRALAIDARDCACGGAVPSDLPRLAHIGKHLAAASGTTGRAPYSLALRRRVLVELMTTDTQGDIAERLGVTRRRVEYHVNRIREAMAAPPSDHLMRLVLLRIAAGLDKCWCES